MSAPFANSTPLPGRLLILTLSGALGGTLGDYCHVFTHTTSYGPTSLALPGLGVPAWVPLLFASATVAIGLTHPWADSITGAKYEPRPGLKSIPHVMVGATWLLLAWAASAFLGFATGGAKDAVIAAFALTAWWLLDRTWTGIGLALISAFLGVITEIAISGTGAFKYAPEHQNLLSTVPTWLPWLYVCASITVGNLGRLLAIGTNPLAKAWVRDPSV